MATLNMSSPWVIRYREIAAMFQYDPQVHVIYDEDNNVIKLYVEDVDKASALDYLLVKRHTFGNVTLDVNVIPPDNMNLVDIEDWSIDEIFDCAFDNNGAYAFCHSINIFCNNMTYVVFRKQVVQYYSDNISDYYGQTSILYQDIARNIFEALDGVYYCTDIEDPVMPSKYMWP